jgi:hypothetical protein
VRCHCHAANQADNYPFYPLHIACKSTKKLRHTKKNLFNTYFFIIFAAQMEPNKPYVTIFNMLLIVIAYGYLAYRLIIFDDYASFLSTFQQADLWLWVVLAATILLMPLNVYCEAGKWRLLLRDIEPMTISRAQQQVYYGFVGAFITPFHAGDYPSRAMLIEDKSKFSAAIGLGLVGTAALLIVELMLGLPAAWLFVAYNQAIPSHHLAIALVGLLLLLVVMPWVVKKLARLKWRSAQMQQLCSAISQLSYARFIQTIGWSLVRYVVWSVQLILALHFCGVDMSLVEYLIALPTYYLVIAVFPSMPALNVAIRGSWSIIIFGTFCSNTAGIAMAITLIWLINTVLPMFIGSVLYRGGRLVQAPVDSPEVFKRSDLQ